MTYTVATVLSLSGYYNASPLRIDTWQRLGDYCAELAGNYTRSDSAAIKQAIADALSILEPIVMYGAFPSKDGFLQLRLRPRQPDLWSAHRRGRRRQPAPTVFERRLSECL